MSMETVQKVVITANKKLLNLGNQKGSLAKNTKEYVHQIVQHVDA